MNIALAIIVHDNRVLIARRAVNVHLGGLWEFPGGKCLDNESVEDCVIREALEETGLTVEITNAWPVVHYAYADRAITLHPFLCAARGQASLSASARWVKLNELDQYEFPSANAPLLVRLQEL